MPHLQEPERAVACRELVSLGLSASVISGIFVGFVNEKLLGAKVSAVVGYMLSTMGWLMMTGGPSNFVVGVGAVCLGCSYQFLYCSHLKIGQLFPRAPGKVITLLCSAGDVSTGVPVLMQAVIRRFTATGSESAGVTRLVIAVYIAVLCLAAIVDFFCVPWWNFRTPLALRTLTPGRERHEGETTHVSVAPSKELEHLSEPLLPADSDSDFLESSAWRQATSAEFILFSVIFVFIFWRAKKFLAVNVRPIFADLVPADQVDFAATLFNTGSVVAFSGTLVMGWVVDAYGIAVGFNLSQLQGAALFGFALLPSMFSVYAICLLYVCVSGFLFGLGTSFVGCKYGFNNIGVLQGALASAAGLTCLISDVLLPRVEAYFDYDFRPLVLMTFLASCASLAVSYNFWGVAPLKIRETTATEEPSHSSV